MKFVKKGKSYMQNRWLDFAKEDLHLAQLAFKDQIFNQVCFHSQQGVEKILKGYLSYKLQPTPKTHSLIELYRICKEISSDFPDIENDCLKLDSYYIPTRYPDALPGTGPDGLPDQSDAKEALNILTINFTIIVDLIK